MKFWSYWHQGKDQAPELVRDCWASWQYFHPDIEHLILDRFSLSDHLDLEEDYDAQKLLKKSIAAYADVIRIELLRKYGGLWLDSTVLCLQPVTRWLEMDRQFFAFSSPGPDRMISNWMMYAQEGSDIIRLWSEDAKQYWKRWVWRRPYYWPHYRFGVCYQKDPAFRAEWDAAQKISADRPHFFAPFIEKMHAPATKEHVQSLISNQSPILKLTYKTLDGDRYPEGSMIQYTMNQYKHLLLDTAS